MESWGAKCCTKHIHAQTFCCKYSAIVDDEVAECRRDNLPHPISKYSSMPLWLGFPNIIIPPACMFRGTRILIVKKLETACCARVCKNRPCFLLRSSCKKKFLFPLWPVFWFHDSGLSIAHPNSFYAKFTRQYTCCSVRSKWHDCTAGTDVGQVYPSYMLVGLIVELDKKAGSSFYAFLSA